MVPPAVSPITKQVRPKGCWFIFIFFSSSWPAGTVRILMLVHVQEHSEATCRLTGWHFAGVGLDVGFFCSSIPQNFFTCLVVFLSFVVVFSTGPRPSWIGIEHYIIGLQEYYTTTAWTRTTPTTMQNNTKQRETTRNNLKQRETT